MPAAKAPSIQLSPDHDRQLKALVRAHSTPQKLAERACIILLASEALLRRPLSAYQLQPVSAGGDNRGLPVIVRRWRRVRLGLVLPDAGSARRLVAITGPSNGAAFRFLGGRL